MSIQSRCGMISKYVFCTQLSRKLCHKFLNHQDNKAIQIRKFCYFDHGINRDWSRTKTYVFGIFGSCVFGVFVNNFEWVGQRMKKLFTVNAAEILTVQNHQKKKESVEQKKKKKMMKKKKKKIGFRDRKIISYENKLRIFSDLKKVFSYFATVEISSTGSIYMTPADFLRAVTLDMQQPAGLGSDQYNKEELKLELDENSIFYKLGNAGLINFSDYIFLLAVCLFRRRRFKRDFGDGNVDIEEFKKIIQELINHPLNTFENFNPVLATYFFGPNKDQKLSIEKFLDFHEQLQKEMLILEFETRDPDANGKITETDFAKLLLVYADYPKEQKRKRINRVKKQFKNKSQGISKEEYLKFFEFLNKIDDLKTKKMFHLATGEFITQNIFKDAARTVGDVELSDNVIRVVHTIFDDNLDGQMSYREFVKVMDMRLTRTFRKKFNFKRAFLKIKDRYFNFF